MLQTALGAGIQGVDRGLVLLIRGSKFRLQLINLVHECLLVRPTRLSGLRENLVLALKSLNLFLELGLELGEFLFGGLRGFFFDTLHCFSMCLLQLFFVLLESLLALFLALLLDSG